MIGKLKIRTTFSETIDYCLSNKKVKGQRVKGPNRATILHYNLCYGSKNQLIRDFENVAALNSRQSRPVFHLTLSLSKGEHLSNNDWVSIAEESAQHFGYENNQYLLISHNDTEEHEHVHIVANRIGFDGKTSVTDSNSYRKVADFSRKMEQQYNLQAVLNPRRYLPKDKRNLPRNDERKNRLMERISDCLDGALSIEDFVRRLRKYQVRAETGRGITFIDDKYMRVKGSAINYPFAKIKAVIANNQQAYQKQMEEQKKQSELKLRQEQQKKQTEFIEVRRSRGFRM